MGAPAEVPNTSIASPSATLTMYPDLCGTAEDDDIGGGTAADDVPAEVTGGRDVNDPALLVDAGLPAPLVGRAGAVAEGFPDALGAEELTTMVDVSEITEVTLTSEVETAPEGLDDPCVAPTAADAEESPCESGYATAIATTTTAPTAARTTARRRPGRGCGCTGSAPVLSGASGVSEPRMVKESCGTTRPLGGSSSGSSSTPALKEFRGIA